MPFIATMQGRLVPPEGERFQSFPRNRWRDEFALASQAGLNGIEWIYDAYGEDANPLASDEGIGEMESLAETNGIAVRSLCADYFLDRPFLRTDLAARSGLIDKMKWLLSRCHKASIGRVVIPFVDHSRIESKSEEAEVLSILQALLPVAETFGIELHLETSLAPAAFAELLEGCSHPLVCANYDSGNSSSLGYQRRSGVRKLRSSHRQRAY